MSAYGECASCRFWYRGDVQKYGDGDSDWEGKSLGECRCFPPMLLPEEQQGHSVWPADYLGQFPITRACDWCGEWQAREIG